ncbi:hypothetical protein PV325_012047, partial [Microctonus aethiopoides]
PDHLTKDFLFPNSLLDESQIRNLSPKCTVRIAGSFDMGWPTKGSGRSYDSLSGTAGSAKAMEPKAAALLVGETLFFLNVMCNSGYLLGIMILLYKNIKCSKVLNASAIKYLDSSFKYCVMKNKGNELEMARAIENIPQHCFNNHKNCGEWCRYLKDPNSYQHSTIGEGFTDPRLYEILTNIFSTLAKKANGFSGGVSSNPNESFNCTVASKAPKSKMYGTSASYSFRVDFAVNKKNDGEKFIVELAKKSHCSPGKNTKKYCDLADSSSSRRYEKSITPKFKRRRLFLRQKKSELRHKNESSEGTTYQSNTGDLCRDCDILQIAVKYEKYEFSTFVHPSRKISENSSQVHGLRFVNGNLELHGKAVIAVSLQEAILCLYRFIFMFKRKCIFAAHNCIFDYPRLMRGIIETFMDKYYETIVVGFADTLPHIRVATRSKQCGDNKLQNLAKRLEIRGFQAHDALGDVSILERILVKLNISQQQLIKSSLNWNDAKEKVLFADKCNLLLKSYKILNKGTSVAIRKKMIISNISFNDIKDTYKESGQDGIARLLDVDENGRIRVTKTKSVITKLCDFLKTKYNI